MRFKGVLFGTILIIVLCSSLASASSIRADFKIDDTGHVGVSGEADKDPELEGIVFEQGKISGTTAGLTDKIKDIWKFKLALDYDEAEIKINLPQDSNIFNIESGNQISISSDLDEIILEINDTKPINIEFFYSIGLSEGGMRISDIIIYIFIVVVVVNGAVIYYLYKQLKKKPKKIIWRKVEKTDKIKILYDTLNEKEKQIVEAVKQGADYQAKIMRETGIPKASLSRYINNLIKKGFIIKEGEGKLSKIKLKNK